MADRARRVITNGDDDGERPWVLHDEHGPARPTWQCLNDRCGAKWPCYEKKAQLLAEIARGDGAWTHVNLYMGNALVDAARDLPEVTSAELCERFMGWVERP